MNRLGGFTLMELIFMIALLVIVMGLAAPSFQSLLERNRVKTQAQELANDLDFARSEAIKRRQAVVMCVSADGKSCAIAGADWALGWLIFADANNDGLANVTASSCDDVDDDEDCVLRIGDELAGRTRLQNDTSSAALTFGSSGRVSDLKRDLRFTLCTEIDVGEENERTITLSPSGHVAQQIITCQ